MYATIASTDRTFSLRTESRRRDNKNLLIPILAGNLQRYLRYTYRVDAFIMRARSSYDLSFRGEDGKTPRKLRICRITYSALVPCMP